MIHIVLYRPEKPLNTGNIMRTVMATKAELIIIGPISFSLKEKDITRSGLDYIKSLSWKFFESYEDFLKEHAHDNIFYVTRYSKQVYSKIKYPSPSEEIFLMFGRESTGIPYDLLKEHLDKTIRIPMVANARSLNLSNCVAIVIYEILRQQNFPFLSTQEEIKGEDFLYK